MTEHRPTAPRHSASLAEHAQRAVYSPAGGGAGVLRLGATEVHLAVSDDVVEFSLATDAGAGPQFAFRSRDVTHWCAETSVLMEVTLEMAAGDEVSIRSPMLVGKGDGCISLTRRITSSGSELVVGIASSPEAMARAECLASLDASPEEGRLLLAALERAAAAATLPRDAEN